MLGKLTKSGNRRSCESALIAPNAAQRDSKFYP
jgi:hypothetical protein